jgi:protein-S-isoprenylcysteine O-methyltransferase Ste14
MLPRAMDRLTKDAWRLRASAAVNLLMIAAFGLFTYSQAARAVSGDFTAVPFAVDYCMLTGLLIVRRRPMTEGRRFLDWLVAGSAWVPLLMQSADTSRVQGLAGASLSAVGVCVTVAGMASLGRSFGIVAANRGLQTRGMYGWLRHPLYFGESLAMVGNVVANPSTVNAALAAVAIACLFPRILAEERLMGASYKPYAARVRWRLLPGVF